MPGSGCDELRGGAAQQNCCSIASLAVRRQVTSGINSPLATEAVGVEFRGFLHAGTRQIEIGQAGLFFRLGGAALAAKTQPLRNTSQISFIHVAVSR